VAPRTLAVPRLSLLAVLAILWGSNFFWIKVALRGLSPDQIVFVRLTLGAVVLLAVVLARRDRLPRRPVLWLHLAVAALVANVIPHLLFAYAEQRLDSSVAGIINATTPLWTVLMALAVRHEKGMTAGKLVGTLVGFLGALLIFAPWGHGSQVLSLAGGECLVAAACYGATFIYMARFLAPTDLPPLTLAAGQLLASSFLAALTLPVLGRHALHLHPAALGAALVLGALGTGAAFVVNYYLITESGASATSLVTYLIPLVAVILGVAVLGESLPLHVVLGAAVVLLGVAATRRRSGGEARPVEEPASSD
jgi:drug/metabolite transporter (DMT)-like permease